MTGYQLMGRKNGGDPKNGGYPKNGYTPANGKKRGKTTQLRCPTDEARPCLDKIYHRPVMGLPRLQSAAASPGFCSIKHKHKNDCV